MGCPLRAVPGSAHPTVPRELALLSCVSPAKHSENPCCRGNHNHHPSQIPAKAAATGAAPKGSNTATLRSGQKGRTTKSGIGGKHAPFLSRRTSNKINKGSGTDADSLWWSERFRLGAPGEGSVVPASFSKGELLLEHTFSTAGRLQRPHVSL